MNLPTEVCASPSFRYSSSQTRGDWTSIISVKDKSMIHSRTTMPSFVQLLVYRQQLQLFLLSCCTDFFIWSELVILFFLHCLRWSVGTLIFVAILLRLCGWSWFIIASNVNWIMWVLSYFLFDWFWWWIAGHWLMYW